MTHVTRTRGKIGETIAHRFFTEHGYTVVATNWRCSYGEIDLIVEQAAWLIVVEVRTRASTGGQRFGTPAQSITWRKQQRLRTLAHLFLQQCATLTLPVHGSRTPDRERIPLVFERASRPVRFDFFGVIVGEHDVPLHTTHTANAF
jgi:uncharacterized protein (TIGR00252 family)